MGNKTDRSRQDLNNAMISERSDDLRRICDMTDYRRGRDDAVEIRGISLDMAPVALDILGMPGAQAFVTLLPDRQQWVCKVVHYYVDGVEVALWQGGVDMLVVDYCPVTAPATYSYRRAAVTSIIAA